MPSKSEKPIPNPPKYSHSERNETEQKATNFGVRLFERERARERVLLELVGELPHVRIEPGEKGESSRTNPYVQKPISISMRHFWISPVCISKVLLHFLLLFTNLCVW